METTKVFWEWNSCSEASGPTSPIKTPDLHSTHWDCKTRDLPSPSGTKQRSQESPFQGKRNSIWTCLGTLVSIGNLLVPTWDTSLLLLPSGAATSLSKATLWWSCSIYMESNTTEVCLVASFRYFLATGNKRKKNQQAIWPASSLQSTHTYCPCHSLKSWERGKQNLHKIVLSKAGNGRSRRMVPTCCCQDCRIHNSLQRYYSDLHKANFLKWKQKHVHKPHLRTSGHWSTQFHK